MSTAPRLLLFSTSTVHGSAYMEYAVPWLRDFLRDIATILFVPYARPGGVTHEHYTNLFRARLRPAGFEVEGIAEANDPLVALAAAECVFVGGGNTFVLLRELWRQQLVEPIRARVAAGMPYMGSSAGSNVAGVSIGTTNDMPIVHPPTFEALGLVPFNINPHYIDADPRSTHMGETRETRIREFHALNAQPVVGLREGALIEIEAGAATLRGNRGGRLFLAGEEARELHPGESLTLPCEEA